MIQELDLLQSVSLRAPGLIHAVTTRSGGVSGPPHDSLNLSWSRPDPPQDVLENRRRLCAALQIPIDRLVQAGQVHGTGVYAVQNEDAGRGAMERTSVLAPADGLITNQPDLYLFACFADCVPLLFWDPIQRAVGLAHAGWRGTVNGMALAMVRALHASYGSRPADLRIYIGPSAGPCCYEVGPDVVRAAQERFGTTTSLLTRRRGEHAFFDLWGANRQILVEAGVAPDHIEVSVLCTIDHAERFFSHRASGGQTGRFAAVIGLQAER